MEFYQNTFERFTSLYGEKPEVLVSAPGRVNLIGEHTDYNDGFVLPVALDRSIYLAAGPRNDNILSIHSIDLQSSVSIPLDSLAFNSKETWSNYTIGVAAQYVGRGMPVRGANICVRGNVPIAAGLSSSAALEVASTIAFQVLNTHDISLMDMIKISCQAETQFVGVQCGIMDQFISMMGKKDHAMFLDCRNLYFENVEFPRHVKIVICDTGIKRELMRSAYNQREAECEEAVRQISKMKPGASSLRDLSVEEFRELKPKMTSLARRRAQHVISENERVVKSVAALRSQDLSTLGRLMLESHQSLRDDFDVSSDELNAFVDIVSGMKGVYGARMTGAGFGGSAICIADERHIDELVDSLKTEYPKQAGRSFTIYITQPHHGAAVVFPKQSMEARNLASTL
jgi:galactokinase